MSLGEQIFDDRTRPRGPAGGAAATQPRHCCTATCRVPPLPAPTRRRADPRHHAPAAHPRATAAAAAPPRSDEESRHSPDLQNLAEGQVRGSPSTQFDAVRPSRALIRVAPGHAARAADLDHLNVEHGVVIRILSHDRNTMGNGRGRNPAIVDRHIPACRAKRRHQQRPGLGDRLIDSQRLEPLSELIGRQPAGRGLRVSGLQHAQPQLTKRDRRDTRLKIGEPAGIESRCRAQAAR